MRRVIAFIPGSFRPPTAAHWRMIMHYAGLASEVIVVVSSPEKAVRPSGDENVELTAEKSRKILETFKRRYGVSNVRIVVSDVPSPVKWVMREVDRLHNATVVIGTSDKGNDAARYDWLPAKFSGREDLKVLQPSFTAYQTDDSVSASDVRARIGDFSFYQRFLPSRLTAGDLDEIRSVLYYLP